MSEIAISLRSRRGAQEELRKGTARFRSSDGKVQRARGPEGPLEEEVLLAERHLVRVRVRVRIRVRLRLRVRVGVGAPSPRART